MTWILHQYRQDYVHVHALTSLHPPSIYLLCRTYLCTWWDNFVSAKKKQKKKKCGNGRIERKREREMFKQLTFIIISQINRCARYGTSAIHRTLYLFYLCLCLCLSTAVNACTSFRCVNKFMLCIRCGDNGLTSFQLRIIIIIIESLKMTAGVTYRRRTKRCRYRCH